MAQAINVILQVKDGNNFKEFDINNMGLVSMIFNRYLGNENNVESQVLSKIDITMFDRTGYRLLQMLQANQGTIRLKYGFEDDMSDLYMLTNTKINATYNNLGVMVAIGAYGQHANKTFPAEYYKRGTNINDMLVVMAQRNGWNAKINTNGLVLAWDLYKEPGETDFEFIYNKVLPVCHRMTYNAANDSSIQFWDCRIFNRGGAIDFYFVPYSERTSEKRVWSYSYGVDTDSRVISLTNSIDFSFLIDGLAIEVPALPSELLESEVQLQDKYTDIIYNHTWPFVQKIMQTYKLPVPGKDEFKFKITIIESEDIGTIPIEQRILNSIKNAISAISSIELTIVGNPQILPTDLIELAVKNNDGYNNIISGRWKVVTIKEDIGLSGYKTTLGLVRENIDIEISSTTYDDLANPVRHGGYTE